MMGQPLQAVICSGRDDRVGEIGTSPHKTQSGPFDSQGRLWWWLACLARPFHLPRTAYCRALLGWADEGVRPYVGSAGL